MPTLCSPALKAPKSNTSKIMIRKSLLSIMLMAAGAAFAEYAEGYYDALDGMKKDQLKEMAKMCVEEHTRLSYTDLPNYWVVSDVYPDLYDGCLRFWDMYSDNIYLILENQTGKQAFSANSMQREHSVPKSWWKNSDKDVEYTPCYSDMWNLYPSDGSANNAKSNYPFGIVETVSFDNGVTKVGSPTSATGGTAPAVFEPADCYKGDFARAIFYVVTVYDDIEWGPGYDNKGNACNTMIEKNTYPTLTQWAIDMLLEWSRQDPVSEKEINRCDAVESCQGNRNPYIDFPDLAEYVWGSKTDDVFYLDAQGGVSNIDGSRQLRYEIRDATIYILGSGEMEGFSLTDISGRTLLRVAKPHGGDSYAIPSQGLIILSTPTISRKILIQQPVR